MTWAIISTWKCTFKGIEIGAKILADGGSALDACEAVARTVEDDPEVDNVGSASLPNACGEIELDAAMMDGKSLRVGGVAGVCGFKNPISIARAVLEKSPHSLIVGRGAEEFALENGFTRSILMTDTVREKFEMAVIDKRQFPSHDTVGIIALDTQGNMACATSTSGLFMKHKGRVSDSALIGAGFYVINEAGGATATGVGEDIMRGLICYDAVDKMSNGVKPQAAAEGAVIRTHKMLKAVQEEVGPISMVCLNKDGEYGLGTNLNDFTCVYASSEQEPVIITAQNNC